MLTIETGINNLGRAMYPKKRHKEDDCPIKMTIHWRSAQRSSLLEVTALESVSSSISIVTFNVRCLQAKSVKSSTQER